MYYTICPGCGASLDPGESCSDCSPKKEWPPRVFAAPRAAGVKSDCTPHFHASIVNEKEEKCK